VAITASVTRGYTFATGVDVTASALNQLGEPTVTVEAISDTPITLQSYSVSSAPAATLGRLIHVTNGDGGSECCAVGDGTYFRVIAMGSTIST
jgi:hypothetical protein